MRWFVVRSPIFICIALCAGLASFANGQTVIELREQATLDRRDLILDDIAIIRSPSLEKLEMLMALPVGRFVGSVPSVVLDRRSLMQWVERHGPNVGVMDWRGAKSIRVAFSVPGTSQDCTPQALLMIRTWLARRFARYEVGMSDPSVTMLAGQQCRIRVFDEMQAPTSRMTVWGDIFEGQRFVRSIAMVANVSAFEEVWMARRRIEAGEPLQSSMFERGTVDVAREGVVAVPAGWETGGFRAIRGLSAGQVLTGAMLAASPDVIRGSQAVMTTRVGPVQLEASVHVLQDGMKGARIPVRVGGGRSVFARVVSQGRLEAIE